MWVLRQVTKRISNKHCKHIASDLMSTFLSSKASIQSGGTIPVSKDVASALRCPGLLSKCWSRSNQEPQQDVVLWTVLLPISFFFLFPLFWNPVLQFYEKCSVDGTKMNLFWKEEAIARRRLLTASEAANSIWSKYILMNRADSVLVTFGPWLFVLYHKRNNIIYSWRTCIGNVNILLLQMLLKIRLNMQIITWTQIDVVTRTILRFGGRFFPVGRLSHSCLLQSFSIFPRKQHMFDYQEQ